MTLTPDQSGRILSVLFEVLPKERPHFQMLAAKKLDEFLQNHTIPASFADNFVASIRKMMECREKEILDAWSDVMIRMIQNMSAEKLESDVSTQISAILNNTYLLILRYYRKRS